MALRNMTKQLFADELIKMTSAVPFDKIRVGELCRRCGADRRTFYYHFMDKYDLAAWIFLQDYIASLASEQGYYTLQHNINTLERMYNNRSFYKAVFSDDSQNAVRSYIYRYFYDLGTDAMKEHFHLEVLPADMDYAVRSHAYACIGLTFEWLRGELNYTPEQFARLQYRFMPQQLKDAYGISGVF